MCYAIYHRKLRLHINTRTKCSKLQKDNFFPYSLLSVGPGADPCVQAVSPQVTLSHPPSGRLPLLSARPAVTFPAEERHHPSAGTKLYCLVTEAHACEHLLKAVTWKRTGRDSNLRPTLYRYTSQATNCHLPNHKHPEIK